MLQFGEGTRAPDPMNPDAEPEKYPLYFTIPKGSWVAMLTAPAEILVRAAAGQNDYTGLELVAHILGVVAESGSPVSSPSSSLFLPGLGTIAQVYQNRNAFTGEDIVPEWESHRPPEERYDELTSSTAIALGDAFNVSPRIIDFAIRDMLGGVSDGMLALSDLVLMAVGYDPKAAGYAVTQEMTTWEKLDRAPIIGRFIGTRRTADAIAGREAINKEIRTAQRLLYENEEIRALNLGVSAPGMTWIGSAGQPLELSTEQRQWYVREWSTQFRQLADILSEQEWYTELPPIQRRSVMESARGKIQTNLRKAIVADIEGKPFEGWSAASIPYLATAMQQNYEFDLIPEYTANVTNEDILQARETNRRYTTMRNRGEIANWGEYVLKTGDSKGYMLTKTLERSKNPERLAYWNEHPELRFFFSSEKPASLSTSMPSIPGLP